MKNAIIFSLILSLLFCQSVFVNAQEEGEVQIGIMEVSVEEITDSSATILWITNIEANGTVDYGEDTGFGMSVHEDGIFINHSLTLGGLSPESDYYFNVTSCDTISNCVTSGPYSIITSQALTGELNGEEAIEIESMIQEEVEASAEDTEISEESLQQAIEDIKGEIAQLIDPLKRRGSLVATRGGIYQTYVVGKPWKLLAKSSASKRVVPWPVELAAIEGEAATFMLNGKEYFFEAGQIIPVDLEDDKVADLEVKLVSIADATRAKFFIKSVQAAITTNTISFDPKEVFRFPRVYIEESVDEKVDGMLQEAEEEPEVQQAVEKGQKKGASMAAIITGIILITGITLYLMRKKK